VRLVGGDGLPVAIGVLICASSREGERAIAIICMRLRIAASLVLRSTSHDRDLDRIVDLLGRPDGGRVVKLRVLNRRLVVAVKVGSRLGGHDAQVRIRRCDMECSANLSLGARTQEYSIVAVIVFEPVHSQAARRYRVAGDEPA